MTDEQTQLNDYHLSKEQRICIISQLIDSSRIDSAIQHLPFEGQAPSHKAVSDLLNKVKETGSINDRDGKGGIVRRDSLDNRVKIVNFVEKYRQVSVREISEELTLSKSYVHRVLMEDGFHGYGIHQKPALRTCEKEIRILYADWYLDLPDVTQCLVWWSDEWWFMLESDIITQNMKVWSRSQEMKQLTDAEKAKQ